MTEGGAAGPDAGGPLIHGCSVCVRADLAQARTLARSFLRQHPGGSFTVLVVDGVPPGGSPRPDDGEMGLALWSPRHLATGSRPLDDILPATDRAAARRSALAWLAATLVEEGRSPLVFLAPTCLVVGSLEPLARAAARSGVAFVPRLIDPSVAHHNQRATADILTTGVIDPGLMALVDGIGSQAWLTWWKSLDPLVAGGARAFDLGPSFGHTVVRDPGIGLSRWNLHERRVRRGAGGLTAGGAPLRTIDFDGLLTRDGLRWTDDPYAPTPAYETGEPLFELASEYTARVAAVRAG